MHAAPGLTVGEAANRLGISPQRVHVLIREGTLDATQVGRQLLVDPVSVQRRLASDAARHRPLDPTNAWALISLASHDDALPPDKHQLSPWALSRVRGRLKRESLLDLAPHLRRRAQVRYFRADPADIARIAQEQCLVRTGVSVAREHGLDIVAPDVLEAYVPEQDSTRLIKRYVLEPSSRPNVILHVVRGSWPFAPGATVAPGLLAALDLHDSHDTRSKRAGREYLSRLEQP